MAKKTSETRKRRRKGVPMSVTALCMVAALLFGGEALPTDTAARWLDTINYEVTCLVSPRVPRVYVD